MCGAHAGFDFLGYTVARSSGLAALLVRCTLHVYACYLCMLVIGPVQRLGAALMLEIPDHSIRSPRGSILFSGGLAPGADSVVVLGQVLYMCFEAMVLLNGLIGVFGNAFVADMHDAAEAEEKAAEEGPARTNEPVRRETDLASAMRERLKGALGLPAFYTLVGLQAVVALAEPVAVGLRHVMPGDRWLDLQAALLALSTAFYLVQNGAALAAAGPERSLAGLLRHLLDGSVLFETVCLGLGWGLLWVRPGIAALRCFRVFRILWLFDFGDRLSIEHPEDHFLLPSNICLLTVQVT